MTNDEYIAALLREREGYERYGRKEEAEEVNKELRRLGYLKDETKRGKKK